MIFREDGRSRVDVDTSWLPNILYEKERQVWRRASLYNSNIPIIILV